jgi:hypothetical protein
MFAKIPSYLLGEFLKIRSIAVTGAICDWIAILVYRDAQKPDRVL